MRTNLWLLALMSLLLQATSAQDDRVFARIVRDPTVQRVVIDAAKRSNVVVENPCSDARYTIANQFSMEKPLVFSDPKTVTAGSWRQVVQYTGCGAERALNVLVTVMSATRLDAHPLLPGATIAGPTLQLDVFKSLKKRLDDLHQQDSNCKSAYVFDTAFLGKDKASSLIANRPPWDELWTLASCSHRATLRIRFAPDSTGTSFTVLMPTTPAQTPGNDADKR